MEGLFTRPVFAGFGPDGLDPTSPLRPLHCARGHRPGVLRAAVRAECPRRPGVYGMLDADGYIGLPPGPGLGVAMSSSRSTSGGPNSRSTIAFTMNLRWAASFCKV